MRRTASLLALSCCVSIVGCQKGQPQAEPIQTADADYGLEPDLYVTPSAPTSSSGGSFAARPVESSYNSYQPPAPVEADALPLTGYSSGGSGRTHIIQKGDTLYGLARKYYNSASRWRDIHEANRNVIPDPNKLYVGKTLVIP